MIRQTLKQQPGKFYLCKRTRYVMQFYQESGTFDVGTPEQEKYLAWTRYIQFARSFKTVKGARAMARLLLENYGEATMIVDQSGKVVE